MDDGAKDFLSSGHRDKVEIMAAIIAMTQKSSKDTHIMNQVHLSYAMLKEYIQFMTDLRLIERHEEVEDTRKTSYVCHATEKGLRFLKIYCDLLRIMYGKNYVNKDENLAVACLQYCREVEKHPGERDIMPFPASKASSVNSKTAPKKC